MTSNFYISPLQHFSKIPLTQNKQTASPFHTPWQVWFCYSNSWACLDRPKVLIESYQIKCFRFRRTQHGKFDLLFKLISLLGSTSQAINNLNYAISLVNSQCLEPNKISAKHTVHAFFITEIYQMPKFWNPFNSKHTELWK